MIEKDHLGDWSPEEDCMLFVTDVSTTCAEAIVRVKIQFRVKTSLDSEDGSGTGCQNVSHKH